MINIKSAKLIDVARTNVPDCFVLKNKIGTAHGEAKLYVGGTTLKNWNEFFNNFNHIQGIITKNDLKTYLDLAKNEYEYQTQGYRCDIRDDWHIYYNQVLELDDLILFPLEHKEYKNKSRYYINSSSEIYKFLRKISLPIMTTLILQKISIDENFYIRFRPYINSIGDVFEHETAEKQIDQIESNESIDKTTQQKIIEARIGQGYYRNLILEKFQKKCAITGVNDERILIASHIKPWIYSNNKERIDKENGLLLSPTFDKLFDKGFITFKNDGYIKLSNYFDENNFKRLFINENLKLNKLYITNELKKYLEYHRDIIFKH